MSFSFPSTEMDDGGRKGRIVKYLSSSIWITLMYNCIWKKLSSRYRGKLQPEKNLGGKENRAHGQR